MAVRWSRLIPVLVALGSMPASPLRAGEVGAPAESPPAASRGGIGDLLVAPTRVVFEGRSRSAEVTLINTGTQAATYRISFVQMRMGESGDIREIEAAGPEELFADRLIRFSPRQVTLAPRVAQTVRLQLRKPAELAQGEYRSHLRFRAVPPAVSPEATTEPATGIRIALTPIYGVTIPVIVRHGETSAQVTLSDLSLVATSGPEEVARLHLNINRTGDRSTYGNLSVKFATGGGPGVVVGAMNGLGVYSPNPVRLVDVALRPPPGVKIAGGTLHVAYSDPDQQYKRFAEADLVVP